MPTTFHVLRNHTYYEFIQWHIIRLLRSVHRRLTTKQTFSNPFTFKVTEACKSSLFIKLLKTITDFVPEDGKRELSFETNQTKTKTILKTTSTFSCYYLMHQFLKPGDSINQFSNRRVKKCMVRVVISETKPFIIRYNKTTEMLTFSGSFEVINEFGVVCSF